MIWIASSKRCTRRPGGSSSIPYALCSLICQPAPSPSTIRPLERWSIVAARLASTAGMVHRGGRDQRADPHPLGDGRDRRQHRPALVRVARLDLLAAGVGHVVVGVPDAVPAVGVGPTGGVEHLGWACAPCSARRRTAWADRNLPGRDRRPRPRPVARPVGGARRVVDRRLHRAAPTPSTRSRSSRSRRTSWRVPRACSTSVAATARSAVCWRPTAPAWSASTRRGTRSRSPRQRGGGPAYARATADELPFTDASFDAVVACLVFEHIDAVDEAIAEVARVVKPGWPIQLLPQSPVAADAGQRLDRRPHGRSSRAVLADRPVPRRDRAVEEVELGVFIRFVHRPLSRYVNTLIEHGLVLERMLEPAPPPGFLDARARVPGAAHDPAPACISDCDAPSDVGCVAVAEIVIITGLSGAGRSGAAAVLEDLGFYVVDNLPTSLLPTIVDLAVATGRHRAARPGVRTPARRGAAARRSTCGRWAIG